MNYNGLMNQEYLNIVDNFYDKKPLVVDTLSEEVKEALSEGNEYFFHRFEEKVHDIITKEKEYGE